MELTEKMSVFEEIKAHVAAGQNINEFSNDAAVLYPQECNSYAYHCSYSLPVISCRYCNVSAQ